MSTPRGSDWPVIRRTLANGWRYKWLIVASVACAMALQALFVVLVVKLPGLLQLLGSANGSDLPPAQKDQIIAGMTRIGWQLLCLAPIAGITAFGAWWYGQLVANRTMQDLRNRLLTHLVRLDLRFHQELSRGDLITRMTNDLSATLRLQQLLYGKILTKPFEVIAMAVGLVLVDWRLTLVVLAVLVPSALVIWPLLRRTRDRSWKARESLERNFSVIEQITAGIKVIKAMGSAEREVERYAGSNRDLVRANMKLAKTRAQSDAVTNFAIFGLASFCFLVGALLFARGWVQPAALVVFLGGIGRMVNSVREIQRSWGDVQENVPSTERMYQLLDRDPALPEKPGAPACPAPRQALRFEGVRFRYASDAADVLRGIDLEVPVGKTVALVGSSGGGKSTVIDLIPRFHDVGAGRITWDGIDIRDFRLDTIAPHVAIVSQDSFLFDDTIVANIAYGRPDATPAEIEQAARRANLHDDVLRLEGGLGYQTRVGDRGGRLSGGQRQRVAIARALLRDAPILLLDEPTSALDAQSEEHVQAALRELMQGRTVVVVAHRLATVQHADRIYVLAGKDDPHPGTVLESGTHAELVAKGGRYAELVRLQQLH